MCFSDLIKYIVVKFLFMEGWCSNIRLLLNYVHIKRTIAARHDSADVHTVQICKLSGTVFKKNHILKGHHLSIFKHTR